jgi:hypothetical protein
MSASQHTLCGPLGDGCGLGLHEHGVDNGQEKQQNGYDELEILVANSLVDIIYSFVPRSERNVADHRSIIVMGAMVGTR